MIQEVQEERARDIQVGCVEQRRRVPDHSAEYQPEESGSVPLPNNPAGGRP